MEILGFMECLETIKEEISRWGFTPQEFCRWKGCTMEYGDLGSFIIGKESAPLQYGKMPDADIAFRDALEMVASFSSIEEEEAIVVNDKSRRTRRTDAQRRTVSDDDLLVRDLGEKHIPRAYPLIGIGEEEVHVGRDAVLHMRKLHII
jgi:hypothetical protein